MVRVKQGERGLPLTHFVERVSETQYILHFTEEAPPHLLTRSIRRLGQYEHPLGISIASDKRSITVTLEQPDTRLALLLWLTELFQPAKHYAKVLHRTSSSLSVLLVDGGDINDIYWQLTALVLAIEELDGKVDKTFIEHNSCVVKFKDKKDVVDGPQLVKLLQAQDGLADFLTFDTPPGS